MSKDKFAWFEKQSEANAAKPAWDISPQDGRREPASTNLEAGVEDSQAVDQSAAGQYGSLETAGQNQQPEPKFKIKTDTKRSASPKQIAANRLNAKKFHRAKDR